MVSHVSYEPRHPQIFRSVQGGFGTPRFAIGDTVCDHLPSYSYLIYPYLAIATISDLIFFFFFCHIAENDVTAYLSKCHSSVALSARRLEIR